MVTICDILQSEFVVCRSFEETIDEHGFSLNTILCLILFRSELKDGYKSTSVDFCTMIIWRSGRMIRDILGLYGNRTDTAPKTWKIGKSVS